MPHLCALVLGVGAALLVGCGDRSALVPPGKADKLQASITAVREATDARDCRRADQAVRAARDTAQGLADGVDDRLRQRLLSGLSRLAAQADTECDQAPLTTTTVVPTTTTTEPPPTPEPAPTHTDPPPDPTTTDGPPSTPSVPVPTDPGSDPGVVPDPAAPAPDSGGASPVAPSVGAGNGQ